MQVDLTRGSIRGGLLRFCLPLVAGNLLQQLYNVVDTWVVGRYVGENALAAVGGAFSLMVLLNSVILGLCMGSGVVLSWLWARGDLPAMRRASGNALLICLSVCAVMVCASLVWLDTMVGWMRVPSEVAPDMTTYLQIILPGMLAALVYNDVAAVLRSVGNSAAPLMFLALSTVVNIVLDVLFVTQAGMGVEGVAWATLIAQGVSALGALVYARMKTPMLLPRLQDLKPDFSLMKRIASVSLLTGLQQSVMNFGILMVQSLVNSFGTSVMAAFAVGVKIDAFAYAPAQDFANGFATFVSQNKGAGQNERMRQGLGQALMMSCIFCAAVSALVGLLATPLMRLFTDATNPEVVAIGVRYLRTEGLCYVGIGILFLMYATFRGMEKAGVSVVLTIVSLGLRVVLSYALAPHWGTDAIWWSIPVGWAAADVLGFALLRRNGMLGKKTL